MMIKLVAVELTTHCNFDCDYCYTKNYKDQWMDEGTFTSIIDSYNNHPMVEFSLSGEGESLLHPKFWKFVEYIRNNTKHLVSVITNGSTLTDKNITLAVEHLYRVRVSIDTADPTTAEYIGRHMHDRVVDNVRRLARVHPHVIILTVNFGQDLSAIRQLIASIETKNPITHGITDVYAKEDYASSYTRILPPPIRIRLPNTTARCGVVSANSIDAYDVTGIKMPCCTIKDRSVYPGYDDLVTQLTNPTNTDVPSCCTGCSALLYERMRTPNK